MIGTVFFQVAKPWHDPSRKKPQSLENGSALQCKHASFLCLVSIMALGKIRCSEYPAESEIYPAQLENGFQKQCIFSGIKFI
jgi:hypothetical protein